MYIFLHIKKDYTENDDNILEIIPVKKEVVHEGFEAFKDLIKLQNRKSLLVLK
jgi:hypothetical protein